MRTEQEKKNTQKNLPLIQNYGRILVFGNYTKKLKPLIDGIMMHLN